MNVAIIAVSAILAYAWLIYPLLVLMAGCVARGRKQETCTGRISRVSIVFSAHNKADVIRERLENLTQSISQTAESLTGLRTEIHIGLDACTDSTKDDIYKFIDERKADCRHWAGENEHNTSARTPSTDNLMLSTVYHVHEFQSQMGKPAVLKEIIRRIKDKEALFMPEVLVFTDANTSFRPGALLQLLGHFADDKVGGTCGRLIFISGETPDINNGEAASPPKADSKNNNQTSRLVGSVGVETGGLGGNNSFVSLGELGSLARENSSASIYDIGGVKNHIPSSENIYWNIEAKLKEAESRIDSCLGANGAIYAIRTRLFWDALPGNTIVDDFVIGMKVREAGYRMIFDPEAVAEEELPQEASEWQRRVRIGAGDFQALSLCRRLLLPKYGFFAWIFCSHKVLRWLTPHLLIALLALTATELIATGSLLSRCIAAGFVLYSLFASLGAIGNKEAQSEKCRVKAVSDFRFQVSCFTFLFKIFLHGLMMQAALFTGFLRYCRGDLKGTWERTPR